MPHQDVYSGLGRCAAGRGTPARLPDLPRLAYWGIGLGEGVYRGNPAASGTAVVATLAG